MSDHDSIREGPAAAGRNPRGHPVLWAFGVALLVFIALQFVRPALSNPPVTADLQAPPEVKAILRNSCYNCHSNETKLPWFDQIVPAYWLVVSDVTEARKHLNFSTLGAAPPARQRGLLFEAVNQIQLGAMPLPAYKFMHPGAVVTPEQLGILRAYLNPPKPATPAPEASVAAADAQYSKWIADGDSHPQVQDELNGVAFVPDYKNWTPISSTDRFDNGTMREILGNSIAIKAIAENHINPWPDGTTFAKVTWAQRPDGTGFVRTGAFVQVELMIKDSQKYASTAGWGWGRWRGTDLKPYGANAGFTSKCVNCHTPVRANDYVYTMPIH
ncbi:MAG TPA: heme-binding domain-containing protein, partial [Silvibacterium sp.]|nr:heme-binding domain-containing protein [Silvibacterium sp.]